MPVTIYYAYMLPTYAYLQNRNNKSMCVLRPPKRNSTLCNCRARDFYRECGGLSPSPLDTDFTPSIGRFGPCPFNDTFSTTLVTHCGWQLVRKEVQEAGFVLSARKEKGERPVAFSYLHSPVCILLSYLYVYIHIHVKRPPRLAAICQ